MWKKFMHITNKVILYCLLFLKSIFKPLVRFLVISLVLAAGWLAFIVLVRIPIDAIPVLIMVWLTIIILLFALFPRILDRVKRFKFKDFEIEFQDTVAKSAYDDYISLADLDEYNFSQKGDFHNLKNILRQVINQPSKPILLVVNLKDGSYVSIPMLFIYIFFIDIFSKDITILFISTEKRLKDIVDIAADSIIGAVSGKMVLQTFYRKLPYLFRIFEFSKSDDDYSLFIFEELLMSNNIEYLKYKPNFKNIYNFIKEYHSDRSEFLSEQDVNNWFKGKLNCRKVDAILDSRNLKTVREALSQGEEYMLLIKDGGLEAVISLCKFSKILSKKVLADMT